MRSGENWGGFSGGIYVAARRAEDLSRFAELSCQKSGVDHNLRRSHTVRAISLDLASRKQKSDLPHLAEGRYLSQSALFRD